MDKKHNKNYKQHMSIKILEIDLPEYVIDKAISYDSIGKKVDDLIQIHLESGAYIERSIGLIDHPSKTLKDLEKIILEKGTDKYDQNRNSIFDEEFSCYQFDIHGNEFRIDGKQIKFDRQHDLATFFGQNIYCFHQLALLDRGYSVRINLIMIYDKKYLLPPLKIDDCEGRIARYQKYLFRFKDSQPLTGLKAIVKIS